MVAVFGLIFNFMTNQELDKQHLAGRTDLLNQFVNPKTAHQVASRLHEILRKVLYEGLHAAFFVTIATSDQYGLCENLYPPSSEIRRIRGIKKERLADNSFLCTHLDL